MRWADMDFTRRIYFILFILAVLFLLFSLGWQTIRCQDLGGLKTGGIVGGIVAIIIVIIKIIERK